MRPGSAGPTEVLEEGEEPAADGQEFQHRDRQVGADVFGYLVEPEQAVAETPDPSAIDVGEAGVRRDVEEDLRRILELGAQQGSFDADPA